MKVRFGISLAACAAAALIVFGADPARAQVTPAAGYTPPDDTPSVKVGGTIFADWTYTQEPLATDADGNRYHPNAFNVTRAYINVTGSINHLLSFRITPDVVRVGQVDGKDVPGLTNTLTYRLKYAFAQLNFDDLANTPMTGFAQWKGSWFRLGMQQTPYIDYEEQLYRYRFQGPIMVDREGFLASSDLGASLHFNFPENFGDIHFGVYNGEGYTRPEANDQKGFMVRGTLRPFPTVAILKGLRLTGFYDSDRYVSDAKRNRVIGSANFEYPYFNFGFTYIKATDQNASATKPELDSEGYSVWVTPQLPNGIGALLRWDYLKPYGYTETSSRKQRLIAGPAYWFPTTSRGIAAAVLLNFEQVRYIRASNPTEERYAVSTLINF